MSRLDMKSLLIRIILAVVLVEVAYLGAVNLALNVPLTQSLLNGHKPEKYAVHWERAWSWYPLRVHARGISVNGQSSSQQWQVDVAEASASMSLLPLLGRTVHIHNVTGSDVDFRLRPRVRPDRDYSRVEAFFPVIRDRDPLSPAQPRPEPKAGSGWKIVVEGIRAIGEHEVWVRQIRSTLTGPVSGGISYQTRGGPFSLSDGQADLNIASLILNDQQIGSGAGTISGTFGFDPYVPADNPGTKSLGYMRVDAELNGEVGSLAFLDFYLKDFSGMKLDGSGHLRGRVSYDRGDLVSGTDLRVTADEMVLSASAYRVSGDGGVSIAVAEGPPETLGIDILFRTLKAMHAEDSVPLFTGEGLKVAARGTPRLLPDEQRDATGGRLNVVIPSVRVPDLRVYQRYLPEQWGVGLNGGQGLLHGNAEYSVTDLQAELNLVSDDTELLVEGYRFETDLDLGLKLVGGATGTATVSIAGSHLKMDETRLASETADASKAWRTDLAITEGTLGIPIPDDGSLDPGFKGLSASFRKYGIQALLSRADVDLAADLYVSELGWLDLLLKNPFGLAVSGAGRAEADLRLRSGLLAAGSRLRVEEQHLGIKLLDYIADGDGFVSLEVAEGGESPELELEARLSDASLRRRGEETAVVEEVALELSTRSGELPGGRERGLHVLKLRIPSARVKDMSVYNEYLPPDSPLTVEGGEADLRVDIRMERDSADGFLLLESDGLRASLNDQRIAGELTLNIVLVGGVPEEMSFDISGSWLTLDNVSVAGLQQNFEGGAWQARFDLRDARIVWSKPVQLEAEADIRMSDSRPFVAVFANHRGKHGWLDRMLTVEDIRGNGSISLQPERSLIPRAMVGSDKIDVGLKAYSGAGTREAMFYARFRKLDGVLKSRNEQRNFDVLGARDTFEAYRPGETPLDEDRGLQPGETATAPQ